MALGCGDGWALIVSVTSTVDIVIICCIGVVWLEEGDCLVAVCVGVPEGVVLEASVGVSTVRLVEDLGWSVGENVSIGTGVEGLNEVDVCVTELVELMNIGPGTHVMVDPLGRRDNGIGVSVSVLKAQAIVHIVEWDKMGFYYNQTIF